MRFVISKENDYLGKVYFVSNETDVSGSMLNKFVKDVKHAYRFYTKGVAKFYAKYFGIEDYEIEEVI